MSAKYMPPKEAAEVLGVTVRYMKDMRVRGDGPPFLSLPGQIRYPLKEFEEWCKSRTVTNTAQRRCRA